MAISEAQLETWSAQGAIAGSRDTYATIKTALEHPTAPFAKRDISVFLQGSYSNETNVWAESDVDVVICTKAIYHYDTSALPLADMQQFNSQFTAATYHYPEFKAEVTAWLQGWFKPDAKPGNKAVEIAANPPRRKADVLIANEFRLYRPSCGFMPSTYEIGVRFVTLDGQTIVNYPKQHAANLTIRHQAVKQWLKPTVRIFKNMRNKMVADKLIAKGHAPSYFIEGMLYNVPTNMLGTSYQQTTGACLGWLWKAPFEGFTCANGIHPLIGEGTPISWPSANYVEFLRVAIDLWNGWKA